MVFWPFLWFWPKHENGQKSIFSLEKWKFFLAHLNHLGRQIFFSFYIFYSVKKSRQKREKAEKMARAKKCPFSIFAHFFWPNQKCKNWKILVSQTEFCVPKKNSTFQNKKLIFGHFCVLAKITKMAKKPFFILKSGNFFGTS